MRLSKATLSSRAVNILFSETLSNRSSRRSTGHAIVIGLVAVFAAGRRLAKQRHELFSWVFLVREISIFLGDLN